MGQVNTNSCLLDKEAADRNGEISVGTAVGFLYPFAADHEGFLRSKQIERRKFHANNDKKYFIPVDGTPIEVSEEVYRAYYQPIWNTRYHAQKNGECRCTKAQLWKCDGVCPGCPFYAAGKKVSIDTPIGGEEDELTLGDTLADDAPSAESILMDKELLDALYDELNRLDPDGRRICELIMQGKTEREIAADMGKRQSTINYQKNKVFSILREALKDFI